VRVVNRATGPQTVGYGARQNAAVDGDAPDIQSLTPWISTVVRLWFLGPGSAEPSEAVITLPPSGHLRRGEHRLRPAMRSVFVPCLF
jgi:hypothetical protein